MAKKKENSDKGRRRPASTPEARENQLISLAVDLAEKQLKDGTASNQVIVHYLKLGSSKEKLEQQLMAKRTELLSAQAESVKASQRVEELYSEALKAMRIYSGTAEPRDDDEYYDEY